MSFLYLIIFKASTFVLTAKCKMKAPWNILLRKA